MRVTDSILVSIDFASKPCSNTDIAVLLVGKKKKNEAVEILNAFQGEEAIELWDKLTRRSKKND